MLVVIDKLSFRSLVPTSAGILSPKLGGGRSIEDNLDEVRVDCNDWELMLELLLNLLELLFG